jgi:glutathione S-transferase
MLTIYNFARGARGLRVFWLCEEMELPYRVEYVSFPTDDAYRVKNPLGSVPFLEDDGGIAINESVAMMLYIAQRYGPTPLYPERDDPRLAKVLQLSVLSEASLGGGINPLLAAHFAAPDEHKQNWSVRFLEGRVTSVIDYVVHLLGDGPYLAGDQLTIADLSVTTSLGLWKGALGKPLPDVLTAYRERLALRPAYQRAIAKQSPAPTA